MPPLFLDNTGIGGNSPTPNPAFADILIIPFILMSPLQKITNPLQGLLTSTVLPLIKLNVLYCFTTKPVCAVTE